MKQILHNQKGNILLLVAGAITVILGIGALAVDVGYMYLERARMVTAADAAALAGAQVLKDLPKNNNPAAINTVKAQATKRAQDIAKENGMNAGEGDKTLNVEVDTNEGTVRVYIQEPRGLFFARIFSRHNINISAEAIARIGAVSKARNVVPIGIDKKTVEQLVEDQITEFTDEPGEGTKGNYHYMEFPGTNGADGLRKDIMNGYNGDITVGTIISTHTGVVSSVKEAVVFRKGDQVIIPIIWNIPKDGQENDGDELIVKGKTSVVVVGFALLEIIDYQIIGPGKGAGVITGKFITVLNEGDIGFGEDYGVLSVKLIK